jgi:hypothetical protein
MEDAARASDPDAWRRRRRSNAADGSGPPNGTRRRICADSASTPRGQAAAKSSDGSGGGIGACTHLAVVVRRAALCRSRAVTAAVGSCARRRTPSVTSRAPPRLRSACPRPRGASPRNTRSERALLGPALRVRGLIDPAPQRAGLAGRAPAHFTVAARGLPRQSRPSRTRMACDERAGRGRARAHRAGQPRRMRAEGPRAAAQREGHRTGAELWYPQQGFQVCVFVGTPRSADEELALLHFEIRTFVRGTRAAQGVFVQRRLRQFR